MVTKFISNQTEQYKTVRKSVFYKVYNLEINSKLYASPLFCFACVRDLFNVVFTFMWYCLHKCEFQIESSSTKSC